MHMYKWYLSASDRHVCHNIGHASFDMTLKSCYREISYLEWVAEMMMLSDHHRDYPDRG